MTVKYELDDAAVLASLSRLEKLGSKSPRLFASLGESLQETTKQRFRTATAPDGTAWAPNSFVTLANFRGGAGSKKPLTGESRSLQTTINYAAKSNSVSIGSPMIYAAVHQFGARQGEFGRSKRGGPLPWGDIPARPFLGVSKGDQDHIKRIVSRVMAEAFN